MGNAVKARACSSHGHAAKAKAAPMGTQPRPRQLPWARGTQPRPVHVVALASHGQEARSQGPMGTLPRPKRHAANGHAAKAKAAPHGTQPRPRHAAKGKAEAPHGHMASGGHGGVSLQTERGKEFRGDFEGGIGRGEGGGTNRSDTGLNLSGSWQQGHSATYNTPSRI